MDLEQEVTLVLLSGDIHAVRTEQLPHVQTLGAAVLSEVKGHGGESDAETT